MIIPGTMKPIFHWLIRCIASIFGVLFFLSTLNAQWKQTGGPIGGAAGPFAVLADRVYGSSDNGITWQNITKGLPANEYHAAILSIDTVLFVQEIYANTFYLSTNKGSTWKAVKRGWSVNESLIASTVMGKYLFAAT